MQVTKLRIQVVIATAVMILLCSQIATLGVQPSIRKYTGIVKTSTHMRKINSDVASKNPKYVNNCMATINDLGTPSEQRNQTYEDKAGKYLDGHSVIPFH